MEIRFQKGIHLPGCDLWLDSQRKVPFGVVTHAHSDHAGWHGITVATPATVALMKVRRQPPAGTIIHELPFWKPFQTPQATITLIPAGHILGSAQVLIETKEGSLLYTGDFKRRESLTCEQSKTVKADTLVMECTFGLPSYAFPPAEHVHLQIIKFCGRVLESGETPVLLAYSLGKSQELMAILSKASITPVVHESIARMSAVYEEQGVELGSYSIWDGTNHKGRVMIIPPNATKRMEKLKNHRTAIVSGWAMDSSAIYRYQCDEAFALSDHADHGELIEHVEEVGAKMVYLVHGFTEKFAGDLRYFGIDALALGGKNQLELLFG